MVLPPLADQAQTPAAAAAQPDFRFCCAKIPHSVGRSKIVVDLGQVDKPAGADLTYTFDGPLRLRTERHESTVRRQRRAALGAFKIGEASEQRVLELDSLTRARSTRPERRAAERAAATAAADSSPTHWRGSNPSCRGRRVRQLLAKQPSEVDDHFLRIDWYRSAGSLRLLHNHPEAQLADYSGSGSGGR